MAPLANPAETVWRAKQASAVMEAVPVTTQDSDSIQTDEDTFGDNVNSLTAMVNSLTAMVKSLSARFDSQEEELAITKKEMAALRKENEVFRKDLNDLQNELSELQTEFSRMQTELSRLTTNNKWLYYRYLLEGVREQVAEEKGIPSWRDIDKADRLTFATEALTQLKEKSPIKDKFKVTPAELASFLTDESDWIRQQGNLIAHSGGQKDIAEAVLSSHISPCRCKLLIATYMMVFEEDPELS